MEANINIPKKPVNKRIIFSRIKRRIFKHTWLVRGAILIGVILTICIILLGINKLLSKSRTYSYLGLIKNFILAPESEVKTSQMRVNILLLGKGGGAHDAPDLTDTIIFLSLSLDKPSIVSISLPRDIWIPEIRAKLNSVYYWGNQKQSRDSNNSASVGGGILLAKSMVEEIVGVPVHYALVVDFNGFKNIIDTLGGIEVEVERDFIDEKFPIEGRENDDCSGDPDFSCRYETIEFTSGMQKMDGETALKFARSRNSQGDEGTDLARAARQENVVVAIKNKIMTKEIFLSPKKILKLTRVILENIETDIPHNSAAVVLRLLFNSRNSSKDYVLSEEFLINPPQSPTYDNLYVFVPKGNGWNEVHQWVEEVLGM